jgi:hypothetical protein
VRPPDNSSIRWYKPFRETGSVEKKIFILDLTKVWIMLGRLSYKV